MKTCPKALNLKYLPFYQTSQFEFKDKLFSGQLDNLKDMFIFFIQNRGIFINSKTYPKGG